jgi:molybdopterin-guanine dinucleotide biosynthesis protein A
MNGVRLATTPGSVATVVLAGGQLEPSLQNVVAVKHKAWIPLGGRLMIERVLDALDGCPYIGERVLVAQEDDVPESVRRRVSAIAPPGAGMMDSIESGVSRLSTLTPTVLTIPCDMPFLEPASVSDFMQRCSLRPAEVWYSYVSREISESRYPGIRHTWVRMAEGTYCGGGLVMFTPPMIKRARSFLARVAAARKNPFKLAGLLGPKIITKLLLRRLTVEDCEERATLLLEGPAVGIESPCADVGFNVDAPEELAAARLIAGGQSPL